MRSESEKIRTRIEVMRRVRDAIDRDPLDALHRLARGLFLLCASAFVAGGFLGAALALMWTGWPS